MSDLDFDAIDEDDGSESDDDLTTDANVRTHSVADASLPHADEALYQDGESQRTADEVDPRKLFANPTVDEIRWYARYSGIASTIIQKPIDDAFKNGVDLDPADEDVSDEELETTRTFFEQWVPQLKETHKKARRDGPAALFYKLSDGNDLNEVPDDVEELLGTEIMTLDKWDEGAVKEEIVEGTAEDDSLNIEIRETGMVIRRNIASPDHRDLLGYIYQENSSRHSAQFINADRAHHVVWGTKDDGYVNDFTVAEWEGNSILLPIYIPLKSLTKAQWAMGQTVFRYSAPLYAVETPERYGQDEFDHVNEQIEGLNAASDITLPPGCSIEAHGTTDSLNPEPYHDKLIEDCCAGTEFTKSVLLGTQTGTVSGSTTDIKNYFNNVQKLRHDQLRRDIHRFLDTFHEWGLIPLSSNDVEINWGPLFKIDTLDRMEALVRLTTAASIAVENYILKPEEVRELLANEWAELDVDIDVDELDNLDQEDIAQMVSLLEAGGGEGNEGSVNGNPAVGQNGGGMEEGQNTDPSDPSSGEM